MKIDRFEITVGFDGGEDLLPEPDLLDVLNVGVREEEELVRELEMRLLSLFLTFHGELTESLLRVQTLSLSFSLCFSSARRH